MVVLVLAVRVSSLFTEVNIENFNNLLSLAPLSIRALMMSFVVD